MYVGGTEHELQLECHLGCFRVSLKETISIPPRSEKIRPGQLLAPSDMNCQGPLEMEAYEKFQKSGKALLARSLIDPGDDVMVRLMNLSSNPQIVYKITVVGTTSAVTRVVESQDKLGVTDCEDSCIPDHLKELYSETIKDLNSDEAEKTKKILLRFQHLFSKSKDDFGRTSVIKHRIYTENAKTTKQPPRRLPHHAADFVDQEVEKMIEK
ncbi:uncharacterized protein LOC133198159 [Saccostrea echinata]|uniref:uncharacterized protein LOC133198159 n=1 Tax=Saccostrea echinata TaxID=191078 RepID=UPI002A8375B6|nr:uncharacterized protein LOC133198159 [Saccostrea echinata]